MRKRLRKQIISIIAACMIITVIPVNAVVYGAQIDNSEDSDTEVTINNSEDVNAFSTKAIPGDSISFQADIRTKYVTAQGYNSSYPMEHPISKYEWNVKCSSGDRDTITITPDSKNQSKCCIGISKDTNVNTVIVSLKITFTDSNGNIKTKSSNNYTVLINHVKYEVNCNMPENLPLNESVVLTPSLSRTDGSGTSIVDNKDVSYRIKAVRDGFPVVDNGDGTFTLTRNASGDFNVRVEAIYNRSMYSRTYSVGRMEKWIEFSSNFYDYEGAQDGTLCLNTSSLKGKDFGLDVYYYISDSDEAKAQRLDKSNYSIRYTDDKSTIYLLLDEDWENTILKQNRKFNLIVAATVGTKELGRCKTSVFTNLEYYPFDAQNLAKGASQRIRGIGTVRIVLDTSTSGFYVYLIDSIESKDTNILSVRKENDDWIYNGIKAGTAYVTVNYHYFKNSKVVYDQRTVPVTVNSEDSGNNNSNLDANGKYNIYDRSQSLSIINDKTIGLNIMFRSPDVYCPIARVTYMDSPYDVFYVYIDMDYNTKIHTVPIRLNSGEITRKLKVEMLAFDKKTVVDTIYTSAEDYAKSLLAGNSTEYTKYKPLVRAMLNYGAASQKYFEFRTDELANRSLSSSDRMVDSIPQSVLQKYNLIKNIQETNGLSYHGTSLVLGDECVARMYFKLDADRDISNYNFWIQKDKTSSVRLRPYKKGDLYYIDFKSPNLSFFDDIVLTVEDERGGHHTEQFSYTPLNYIARAYATGKADAKMKDLLNSLYWFEYQKKQVN